MSPKMRRKRYRDAISHQQEAQTAKDGKVGTVTSLGVRPQISFSGKPPISVQDLGGNHRLGELQLVYKPDGDSQGTIIEL